MNIQGKPLSDRLLGAERASEQKIVLDRETQFPHGRTGNAKAGPQIFAEDADKPVKQNQPRIFTDKKRAGWDTCPR
ncbi:hypothetical protein SBA7_80010 [Candidatus Sulfotelmatobacter sp. SbA7]|nr:hypothetical protein SBA7_80010 [Candidatus Sulfotelmatobacter sp. SbA7]